MQSCRSFECYSYLGISKHVGHFPYLGTMISKCGPGTFVVFISIVCVISFVVYLSVEFSNDIIYCRMLSQSATGPSCTRLTVASNSIQFTVLASRFAKLSCIQQYFQVEIQAVLWLWRLLAGLQREDLDSILDQSVLDLWWTEWRWDRFYLSALRFSPVSFIPTMPHTHSAVYCGRCRNLAVDSVFKLRILKCPKSEDCLSVAFIKCARDSRVNTWSRAL